MTPRKNLHVRHQALAILNVVQAHTDFSIHEIKSYVVVCKQNLHYRHGLNINITLKVKTQSTIL